MARTDAGRPALPSDAGPPGASRPPDGEAAPFDPISLEIMWSRLINIAEECWITILRTAFSTIIGEAQDFGCEVLDADAGSIAHASDIGGTRDSLNAREVYDEGLQIPPLKLYRQGDLNDDLMAMIGANVRRPEMVLGDIQAQVSSNRIGAERLLAFMDEYR